MPEKCNNNNNSNINDNDNNNISSNRKHFVEHHELHVTAKN